MPKLTSKRSQFSSFKIHESPYYQNEKYLLTFYKNVATKIVDTFTTNYTPKDIGVHKSNWNIRRIDVSGYHLFSFPDYFKNIKRHSTQSSVNDGIMNIELMIDVSLHSKGQDEDLRPNLLNDIGDTGFDSNAQAIFASPSNLIFLKFVNVALNLNKANYKESPAQLIQSLKNDGAQSITLWLQPDGEDVHKLGENMFDKNGVQMITGLSMEPKANGIGSSMTLSFLQRFSNLIHLSLSRVNLHGCLHTLRDMNMGLVFLSLQDCSLKDSDVGNLIGSCHEATLRELNLAYNRQLGEDYEDRFINDNSNLSMLCRNLTNVQILILHSCYLHKWLGEEMEFLCESLITMPNLVFLNLCFSHIDQLEMSWYWATLAHKCDSLRYIILGYPIDILRI